MNIIYRVFYRCTSAPDDPAKEWLADTLDVQAGRAAGSRRPCLGVEFDAVNENLPEVIERMGGDTRKVFANEYWDDRAVRVP